MTGALGALSGIAGAAADLLTGQVGMTHRFQVFIDSSPFSLGAWARVSGLQVTWNRVELRTGDSNVIWLAPGNATYSNIKLSRAACTDSNMVQEWLKATSRSNDPNSGVIQMVDWIGSPVVEWQLKEFFPIGWSIVDFDSNGSKPAVETLELAHNGFLDDEITFGDSS